MHYKRAQYALVLLFLPIAFSFVLSGCTSIKASGTVSEQTDTYGDNSTGEKTSFSELLLSAYGLGWLMPAEKQSTPETGFVQSSNHSRAVKPGQVSITGNNEFFTGDSTGFFNTGTTNPFFINTNRNKQENVTNNEVYVEDKEDYKHFILSLYLSGVYKMAPSLDEYPWLWGYVGPGIEWSPIPHLGLGLRLGDVPPVDNNLAFININVYYYFKKNGLKGLYLGGEMNHYWINDEIGENSVSDLYFQPKIGYKLTLLDFISIDLGAGYGLGFLVWAGENYHGPSASISTGISF